MRCTKRGWLSKRKAEEDMASIARDPDRTRVVPVRAYLCDGPDGCGMYHLTAFETPPLRRDQKITATKVPIPRRPIPLKSSDD